MDNQGQFQLEKFDMDKSEGALIYREEGTRVYCFEVIFPGKVIQLRFPTHKSLGDFLRSIRYGEMKS